MTQTSKAATDTTSAKAREDAARAQRARAEREARESAATKAKDKNGTIALPADTWLRLSQVATIGLFVIAVLWAAYVAQPVVVPVVLAWTIATIVLPIVRWMQDHRVP